VSRRILFIYGEESSTPSLVLATEEGERVKAFWMLPIFVISAGCDTRPVEVRLAERKARETSQVQAVQNAVNVVLTKAVQAEANANLPGATPSAVRDAGIGMATLVQEMQVVQIPVLEDQALTLKLRDVQRHGVSHLSHGGKAIVIRSRQEALRSIGDVSGAASLEVDRFLSAEIAQTSGRRLTGAFADAWKLVDRPLEQKSGSTTPASK
jgi:hypothetical protein